METKIIALHVAPGVMQETEQSFISLFKHFNYQDSLENGHSKGTILRYGQFSGNLERYLKTIGAQDLSPKDMTIPLLRGFAVWLKSNLKSCSRTHISKHVRRINKAMDFAVTQGLIDQNPTRSYHIKRDRNKEPVSLESEEFLKWINASWHQEIYTQAQDNWTFQMSTGISYQDIFTYKTRLQNEKTWIESKRGKSGRTYFIPIWHEEFFQAKRIHEKYKGKLPYIKNHFYNRLIREMAAQLGIEKYLTTHIGRKTFATLKDENGWNLGPISAMLGNTKKVCEEHYIRPSKKSIENELRKRSC